MVRAAQPNAPNPAVSDVPHNAPNHVVWVVLHSAQKHVALDVQMVVLESVEVVVLHHAVHYAEVDVIILVGELVILYVRDHAFSRIPLVVRAHVMVLATLHAPARVDHFAIPHVKM